MKKLAIVGLAPGFEDAPIEGDVWGVTHYFMYRYCSMAFEMHDLTWTVEQCFRHQLAINGHLYSPEKLYKRAIWMYRFFEIKARHINTMGIPFMSIAEYKEGNSVQGIMVPTSVRYPLDDVLFEVVSGRRYLTSTASAIVAYAIYTGQFNHIEIYGCSMNTKEEWGYQKPNMEYLIGIAEGRDIRVDIMGVSDLLATPNDAVYGYLDSYKELVPKDAEPSDDWFLQEVYDEL